MIEIKVILVIIWGLGYSIPELGESTRYVESQITFEGNINRNGYIVPPVIQCRQAAKRTKEDFLLDTGGTPGWRVWVVHTACVEIR